MTLCLLVSCQKNQSHDGKISDTSAGNDDLSVFDVQDGKLIGAVTHVLVNQPDTGYGIFIENMLAAAG